MLESLVSRGSVLLSPVVLIALASGCAAPRHAGPSVPPASASAPDQLPAANRQDFEDAGRGLVARPSMGVIRSEDGRHVVWNLDDYAFLAAPAAPPTVNPSLWRQAQLNMNHGLFRVTDRIYQVRGLDLSNMTLVEGDTGLIVVDTLISMETARAALDLYYQHRPRRPVVAVIYTHSHVDHYGGVAGIVSEPEVRAGKVAVLAPDGFLEHAVSENIMAGNAMARRAIYMYGALLPRGERGQVDAGLGKSTSLGTVTLIAPTDVINRTGEKRTIDGVEIVFQMAPDTEAPAEMLLHFPQFRALCVAEDATHTLHNLYTLRGAEVRDAAKWWKTLQQAIELFGDQTDVVFAQHHWPKWGRSGVLTFLEKQRDLYKFIHDQSLRLMNQGYTSAEIAEMLELPPSLASEWYNRGYYGSVRQNAKAVYQKYLGWYDGNPAHLDPLPPEPAARRYVEYMGGAAAVIERARQSFAAGDYRWTAEVMNHVVFAEPHNAEARRLAADALERLGYQTENATWRNEYLAGAYELRHGIPRSVRTTTFSPSMLQALTLDMYFDVMGVMLDGQKATGKKITLNWTFPDVGQKYALVLQNSALTYTSGKHLPSADATITLSRATLDAISLHRSSLLAELLKGKIHIHGNPLKARELFELLDTFDPMFPIVTP